MAVTWSSPDRDPPFAASDGSGRALRGSVIAAAQGAAQGLDGRGSRGSTFSAVIAARRLSRHFGARAEAREQEEAEATGQSTLPKLTPLEMPLQFARSSGGGLQRALSHILLQISSHETDTLTRLTAEVWGEEEGSFNKKPGSVSKTKVVEPAERPPPRKLILFGGSAAGGGNHGVGLMLCRCLEEMRLVELVAIVCEEPPEGEASNSHALELVDMQSTRVIPASCSQLPSGEAAETAGIPAAKPSAAGGRVLLENSAAEAATEGDGAATAAKDGVESSVTIGADVAESGSGALATDKLRQAFESAADDSLTLVRAHL